jgi:CMP-N,N'-diacetyllegionaminic acid synthase
MRVLGVIPARGGSKGVPRKNIRPLCGKPLLQYTVETALAARRLTRIVLSTDDAEIADVGRRCGIEVPFMRPAHLARDDTPMLPVVRHALRAIEAEDGRFDAVCLLQPTNPLRSAESIDGCIALLEASGADAVMTVLPVPTEYNPHWVYVRAPKGELLLSTGETQPVPRRQELPAAFHREGSVYVTLRDAVMEQRSLYGRRVFGYEVDPSRSINIDDASDWVRAEAMLAEAACDPI